MSGDASLGGATGMSITLTPSGVGTDRGISSWLCRASAGQEKYVPGSCRA